MTKVNRFCDCILFGYGTGGHFLRSLCLNEESKLNNNSGDAHYIFKHVGHPSVFHYYEVKDQSIESLSKKYIIVQILVTEKIIDYLVLRTLNILSTNKDMFVESEDQIRLREIYNRIRADHWPEYPGNDFANWPDYAIRDLIKSTREILMKYSKPIDGIRDTDFLINAEELFFDIEPVSITNWLKTVHHQELNIDALTEYRKLNKELTNGIHNKISQVLQ